MLGLYVSGHPLDGYEDAIAAQIDTPLATIVAGELKHGAEVTVGGIISGGDRRFSKKDGSPWAIVTMGDHNGASVELLVFNKVYSIVGSLIVEDNIILAKAHISIRDDRMSLFCDDLRVPELGPGNGQGLPLRLSMRTDQCTMSNICLLYTSSLKSGFPTFKVMSREAAIASSSDASAALVLALIGKVKVVTSPPAGATGLASAAVPTAWAKPWAMSKVRS